MKRKDLIRLIEEAGCVFIRHGGRHDWYQNPETKISQPIPRHNEIKDSLSKHILKMLKGNK
jgi:mRNA interferase HicA